MSQCRSWELIVASWENSREDDVCRWFIIPGAFMRSQKSRSMVPIDDPLDMSLASTCRTIFTQKFPLFVKHLINSKFACPEVVLTTLLHLNTFWTLTDKILSEMVAMLLF